MVSLIKWHKQNRCGHIFIFAFYVQACRKDNDLLNETLKIEDTIMPSVV